MSKAAKGKAFIAELDRQAQLSYNSLFTVGQLKVVAQRLGLGLAGFNQFIDSLNNQGYLLKRGAKTYKLNTAEF